MISNISYNKKYYWKHALMFLFFLSLSVSVFSQFETDKDVLFKQRIQSLHPDLNLPYQSFVKDYITKYIISEKAETEKTLSSFLYYKTYIKEELKKQELPESLQYLPLALTQMRLQYKGAYHTAGVWDLPVFVALKYGLIVSDCIDERMDVEKSTQAALKYLKELYYLYGNFWDVIIAYTEGPSGLNATQIRFKNTVSNPWDLYYSGLLKNKVIIPNYISYAYIAEYYELYALKVNDYKPIQTTCIQLSKPVNFNDFFHMLAISDDTFRLCNPCYVSNTLIPFININIPQYKKRVFETNKDSLYLKYEIEHLRQDSLLKEEIKKENEIKTITYTVRSGDYLGRIADKFNVSVANIKKWNHLKSDRINIGQRLIIYKK
jgi:membrane-bound lytic murein transglycosylase D